MASCGNLFDGRCVEGLELGTIQQKVGEEWEHVPGVEVPAEGGFASITARAPKGCPWRIQFPDFVSLKQRCSFSGDGVFGVYIEANPDPGPRAIPVTTGSGVVLTIMQRGQVDPENKPWWDQKQGGDKGDDAWSPDAEMWQQVFTLLQELVARVEALEQQ